MRRTSRGFVVWLTGLSGAGKSTIADLLQTDLRARSLEAETLDGETLRTTISRDLGFSREDRDTHVQRIADAAALLSDSGVNVIVAAIAPYRQGREMARDRIAGRFVEVYVKASVQECARRDVKGLYRRALAGEIPAFTGVSDPYEEPDVPDVVVETETETAAESAATVLAFLDVGFGAERAAS